VSLHTFSSEQQLAINHTCFNTFDTLLTTLLAYLIGFFSLKLGVAILAGICTLTLKYYSLVARPRAQQGSGKNWKSCWKPSSYSKPGYAWTSPLVQTESFPGYIGAQLVNKSACWQQLWCLVTRCCLGWRPKEICRVLWRLFWRLGGYPWTITLARYNLYM